MKTLIVVVMVALCCPVFATGGGGGGAGGPGVGPRPPGFNPGRPGFKPVPQRPAKPVKPVALPVKPNKPATLPVKPNKPNKPVALPNKKAKSETSHEDMISMLKARREARYAKYRANGHDPENKVLTGPVDVGKLETKNIGAGKKSYVLRRR